MKKSIISDIHHGITYMYINFQQNRVNESVKTVHINVFAKICKLHQFAKIRKLHKFANTNNNNF